MLLTVFVFRGFRAQNRMAACAIRTRRRSPNTCFNFPQVSETCHEWLPLLSQFCVQFSFQVALMSKKDAPNTAPKTEAPATRKKETMVRPGRSPAAPLACALFRQETAVRAAVEAQSEILIKKMGLGSNLVEKN